MKGRGETAEQIAYRWAVLAIEALRVIVEMVKVPVAMLSVALLL